MLLKPTPAGSTHCTWPTPSGCPGTQSTQVCFAPPLAAPPRLRPSWLIAATLWLVAQLDAVGALHRYTAHHSHHAAGAASAAELAAVDDKIAAQRLYAAAHRGELAVLVGWVLFLIGAAAYVVLTGPGFALLGALLFICAGVVWAGGHCMNIWGCFTAAAGGHEGGAAAAAAPAAEGGATATAMPARMIPDVGHASSEPSRALARNPVKNRRAPSTAA
jgi:hypothetical protein